jgi:outer membrane protein
MNMIRTLQLDPSGDYTFVAPEIGASSRSFASLDLEALTEQALANRPDLKSSEISVMTAQQGIRTAAATRWPSLSLSTGYNSGNFNSNSRGGFVDQLDSGRRGNLSLNLSLPILDFTYGITRERAQITLANARMNLENTRQTVAIEVRTAYLDFQLAEQALEVAQAQMVAADRALEIARTRFDVSAATLLELEQSQLAQLRASLSLVSARYDVIFQSRLFDYYLGNLRAENIIQ